MTGIKIISLDRVGSTNDYAKRIAASRSDDVLITAREQTAGRGRMGRTFFSPEGGIYMSLVLHPDMKADKTDIITVMAAVAVAKTIESVFGVRAGIKWVNDIYIGGKKVCGILTEGKFDPAGNGFEYAVLGVGVNLSEPQGGFPDEIKDIAGTVCQTVSDDQRREFTERFLSEFYRIYESRRGFLEEYKKRSVVLGREIEYLSQGEVHRGLAVDITDRAELVIKDAQGIKTLRSGEIKIIL